MFDRYNLCMDTLTVAPTVAVPQSAPAIKPFRVHAFGGGVQSLALLLSWSWDTAMKREWSGPEFYWQGFFAQDDLPDVVMFADTQREPKSVYKIVEEARHWSSQSNVPFEVMTAGDLGRPVPAKTGTQGIFTPVFTVATKASTTIEWADRNGKMYDNPEDVEFDPKFEGPLEKRTKTVRIGDKGQLRRQCTERYKISLMTKRAKKLAKGRPIEIWLGFSSDEVERMKPSWDPQITYRYPLVTQGYMDKTDPALELTPLGPMSRNDCIRYLRDLEAPTAKSACTFCPYRNDVSWGFMKANDPESFEEACLYDEWVRDKRPGYNCFVHSSRTPLREIEFRAGNPKFLDLGLFATAETMEGSGCEDGYCGF